MEDQAIKDGFAHLEPSTKYDALYEAALCRERADWIVGMNATRLFSCLYHQTLNIGRVMTPTLAMVVMRDAEIAAFQPKPFYTVQLGMNGITVASRHFDEKGDAQQLLAKRWKQPDIPMTDLKAPTIISVSLVKAVRSLPWAAGMNARNG